MRDSASRPLFLPYATGKTCRLGLENHSPLMQRCIHIAIYIVLNIGKIKIKVRLGKRYGIIININTYILTNMTVRIG